MSKINIACKLPAGFTIDHKGTVLTLNGPDDAGSVLGFGITRGVDEDWFKSWAKEMTANFKPLSSGAIYPLESKDAEGELAEVGADVRTGFEALDPDAPMPGIEPTEEQKRALAEEAGAEATPKPKRIRKKPGENKPKPGKEAPAPAPAPTTGEDAQ